MKKEIFNHTIFFLAFFLLLTVINSFYSLSYWPLWIGGLVGTFIPDIDQLLYCLVFKPYELSSQRVLFNLKAGKYLTAFGLLYDTRLDRGNLVFHSFRFTLIFAILTFWVVSSSDTLFGQGLVLAFYLHLCVDFLKRYLDGEVIIFDKGKSFTFLIIAFLALFIFALLL